MSAKCRKKIGMVPQYGAFAEEERDGRLLGIWNAMHGRIAGDVGVQRAEEILPRSDLYLCRLKDA
jgi:hypothetical protein